MEKNEPHERQETVNDKSLFTSPGLRIISLLVLCTICTIGLVEGFDFKKMRNKTMKTIHVP